MRPSSCVGPRRNVPLALLALVASAVACSSSGGGVGPSDGGGVGNPGFVPHTPTNHIVSVASCPQDAGATSACTTASDCGAGKGCMCGDLFPGNATVKPNECVAAQCATDSDCGVNGYCSPSVVPLCGASGTDGFYCHTASDACDDDADCNRAGAACVWTGSAWGCVTAGCAG